MQANQILQLINDYREVLAQRRKTVKAESVVIPEGAALGDDSNGDGGMVERKGHHHHHAAVHGRAERTAPRSRHKDDSAAASKHQKDAELRPAPRQSESVSLRRCVQDAVALPPDGSEYGVGRFVATASHTTSQHTSMGAKNCTLAAASTSVPRTHTKYQRVKDSSRHAFKRSPFRGRVETRQEGIFE